MSDYLNAKFVQALWDKAQKTDVENTRTFTVGDHIIHITSLNHGQIQNYRYGKRRFTIRVVDIFDLDAYCVKYPEDYTESLETSDILVAEAILMMLKIVA